MSKSKAGGGINSNKNVEPKVRVGSRRINDIDVSGASQLSYSTQFKKSELVQGRPKDFDDLGNYRALNVGKGGPGTGRALYGQCGTQSPPTGHSGGKFFKNGGK